MRRPLTATIFVFVFATATFAKESVWLEKLRGVQLLKVKQAEFEREFGNAEPSTYLYYKSYKTEFGHISVEYSKGKCSGLNGESWDVPELTVTRIFVAPSRRLTPSKLGIRTKGFKKFEVNDVPGAFSFEDERNGMNFSLWTDGTVESISLYPGERGETMRCK